MDMTLSRLVFRSMRKNVKHYYLYFFALIFSVTLCFSFTTLQNNPTVFEAIKKSGTATSGFKAATFVLYFIITFFVLYANHLFMKRRSKEIGLYQLIGMTKGLIVRIIALENIILFVLAVSTGMGFGYLSSRLFALILMKILEINTLVKLAFSTEAFIQSVIIFAILLVVILLQMAWMIYRVTLLSLFNGSKKADERIKRFSPFQMLMGLFGLFLVAYGYYESTCLFDLEKSRFNNLFLHMIVILGSTIIGTFLFFRYSVALIMNTLRARKKGHLKITDVLAVTPIMHRMKGNAKSLTLITVLTGLAVGITSLSYIAFYSAESSAREYSPYDYILINDKGYEFLDQLKQEGIGFKKDTYQISEVTINLRDLLSKNVKASLIYKDEAFMSVIPLSDFQQIKPNLKIIEGEAFITSYPNMLSEMLPLKEESNVIVKSGQMKIPLFITDIREDFMLSGKITMKGPVLVVTDSKFKELSNHQKTTFQSQIGINLVNSKDVERAEEIYKSLEGKRKMVIDNQEYLPLSFEEERKFNISTYGITIFVTAFLGLAFLLTTGSILYFKQMAEAEEEKDAYTILRKIGFSTSDLMRGIYVKQAFNFGVPLIIGLLHSYFAVKSGWWLFGTELVVPLVATMILYVAMYTVFAILSTIYYKKVIRGSL